MPGDINKKYGSSAAFTFTSLNSLAGSGTFLAGAGCLAIDNTTNLYSNYIVGGKVTWSSTAPAAGTYRLDVHAFGSLNDTPDYPEDGSGNSLGTDTARTFASSGDKFNAAALARSVELSATASKVYTIKPFAVMPLFGDLPKHIGLWVTHGVTTASSTPGASGNTFWYTGTKGAYT